MEKALFCWSGGKDSALALQEIQRGNQHEIVSLLTTITEDYDRISMHGVRRILLEHQAKSLSLPLTKVFIPIACSDEQYEAKIKKTLAHCKDEGVSMVVFGDIFLEEVRRYREDRLSQMEMRGLFPIWGEDTAHLSQRFITQGFAAVITCVDTRVLDKSFAGRLIDRDLLSQLPDNIDPCGENGEYHSFVFDGPIFKEKIDYVPGEEVLRGAFYFHDLLAAKRGG
jgi:uncharacterized protein (TIGR00290 family)